ncbi:MAG: hypothetical protein ACE5EV_02130 [Gaiellales bacterium]
MLFAGALAALLTVVGAPQAWAGAGDGAARATGSDAAAQIRAPVKKKGKKPSRLWYRISVTVSFEQQIDTPGQPPLKLQSTWSLESRKAVILFRQCAVPGGLAGKTLAFNFRARGSTCEAIKRALRKERRSELRAGNRKSAAETLRLIRRLRTDVRFNAGANGEITQYEWMIGPLVEQVMTVGHFEFEPVSGQWFPVRESGPLTVECKSTRVDHLLGMVELRRGSISTSSALADGVSLNPGLDTGYTLETGSTPDVCLHPDGAPLRTGGLRVTDEAAPHGDPLTGLSARNLLLTKDSRFKIRKKFGKSFTITKPISYRGPTLVLSGGGLVPATDGSMDRVSGSLTLDFLLCPRGGRNAKNC